jgi:hypothetical protein
MSARRRPTPAIPPLPTLDELRETPEEADADATEDEDDDEDEAPRVLLGRVEQLQKWMPKTLARTWYDRPVWFLRRDDEELMGLFERIPEDPVSKGVSEAILGGLRTFASERNDALQAVLGVTDGLAYGFHVDASLKQVTTSFEDDGFDVVGELEDGEVVLEEAGEAPAEEGS